MLKRILIADRHIFFCLTMEAYLEKNRRNFVGFCSDKELFYEKVKELKPDILVLEYKLFRRETFKVIEKVKQDNFYLKILVIGSHLSNGLYKTLKEEGVDACLEKPFSETDFIIKIDELSDENKF